MICMSCGYNHHLSMIIDMFVLGGLNFTCIKCGHGHGNYQNHIWCKKCGTLHEYVGAINAPDACVKCSCKDFDKYRDEETKVEAKEEPKEDIFVLEEHKGTVTQKPIPYVKPLDSYWSVSNLLDEYKRKNK